jgi:hypothetical protein
VGPERVVGGELDGDLAGKGRVEAAFDVNGGEFFELGIGLSREFAAFLD